LPKSPKLPKIAEIEKAKPHHGSTRVTLIEKNKTFETQRNRGHGGARISADQKGKKSEPTEDTEEHGAVNSGDFQFRRYLAIPAILAIPPIQLLASK